MTIPATISLTETQGFTALRSFIVGALPAAVEVFQGQENRVPEPSVADFIVMYSLRQERLGTTVTDFFDNVLTGSVAGTVLTVTAISQSEGGIQPGMLLIDAGWPTMNIAPNTVVGPQLSGTPGGVGTYQVAPSQTLASETLYAGLRADLAETKWTVQLDVHGPMAGDNAKIIEALFFSEYGVDAFADSGFDVTPIHCSEARQLAFVNAEAQYENRYSLDASMQINPVIGTPQQFFDTARATLIEILAAYGS